MGYSFVFDFSEEDVDFNPISGQIFNYNDFLINEFFNSTDDEINIIMRAYYHKFGNVARNYVYRTYFWGWRNGNRTLTNVQERRILEIMPDLLSNDAKARLNKIEQDAKHRLGIKENINAIKITVSSYFDAQSALYSKCIVSTENDIVKIAKKEFERAQLIQSLKQTPYVKSINFYYLSEQEAQEALKIAQYIIFTKLKKQFEQIARDLEVFMPFMSLPRRGIFKPLYIINNLNLKIDISKVSFYSIAIPNFWIKTIKTNSRFKVYSEKYLAYELVNMSGDANKAVSDSFLNANDIKVFFDHYHELFDSNSEIIIKSNFIGEGGNLSIEIKMKSDKMFKVSALKSIIKLLSYSIIFFGTLSVAIKNDWYPLLFIGGIIGSITYYNLLATELTLFQTIKTESKIHGS